MGIVDKKFWTGKKVFITGHTGFKGSWLSMWLNSLGSTTKGYALNPIDSPSLFNTLNLKNDMISEIGDIRDFENLKKSILDFNPDILIHLAAQPLVRLSYNNPTETYETNVMGTLNVLEACRSSKNLRVILSITTDKCYENFEWDRGYKEEDKMGGSDPYSSSKGCCELLISSYRRSFFNSDNSPYLASARAGNVIGGGDWSKDRLIPDILNSLQTNKDVFIRYPEAVRPWQHVIEPLSGYLVLCQALYKDGKKYDQGWNFGPKYEDCKSVKWIITKIQEYYKDLKWSTPKKNYLHEAGFLKLDISKAQKLLNWKPKWNIETALNKIYEWHDNYVNHNDMRKITFEQIKNYSNNE